VLWGETVHYCARWQGSSVAVRFGERDATWAELDARASSLAAALADRGVGHGDRVGLLMSNRPEFLEVGVACARLGAIVAPFNLRFTPPELAYVARDADCAVIVTESALRVGLALVEAETPDVAVLDADDDDGPLAGAGTAAHHGHLGPAIDGHRPGRPVLHLLHVGHDWPPQGAVLTHESWFYASMVRAL